MRELREDEKIAIGYYIAEILMLRVDKGYNPKRFKTIWGNKSYLGLYETVKRILTDKEFTMVKPGQVFF
jgi:hypothetical protein